MSRFWMWCNFIATDGNIIQMKKKNICFYVDIINLLFNLQKDFGFVALSYCTKTLLYNDGVY